MVEQKIFNGIMNLDDANDVLPSRHHKYAMNVKFRGNTGNIMAENINGNQLITNTLPAGQNECIGAIFDDLNNRVYWFNWNSNGRNGIYYYDTLLKTVTPVLRSFTNSVSDIFNFSKLYPIASVNILYKGTEDGDVLYWTDRLNRPMCLNIKTALGNQYYNFGTAWETIYLTVAKPMPSNFPVCSYPQTTSTVPLNNLKNKLYQFRYRWVFRDNTKSTWSQWSKLVTPLNADDLATEKDPTKNNRISVVVETGTNDAIKIEICARQSLSETFGTPFLATSIDKSNYDNTQTSIPDNSTFEYLFYNDSSYEFLDEAESLLLFDYVPKKANTQELVNGNLLVYGGLTEGNTYNSAFNVTNSLSLIDNSNSSGLSIIQIDIPYGGLSTNGAFVNTFFYGGLNSVTSVQLTFTAVNVNNPGDIVTETFTSTVVGGGLTALINDLALQISTSINFQLYSAPVNNSIQTYPRFNQYIQLIRGSYKINQSAITTYDVNSSCYKHNSRYSFGMVYFDEYGVTNGVVTSNSMKVVTPEITGTAPGITPFQIPNIQFSVNHQPPSWARTFSFVRTNSLSISDFKTIVTDNAFTDSSFGYLDITNFNTNTLSYPIYDFTKGDRIRIIGKNTSGSPISVLDLPILDLIKTQPPGSTFPATGFFLKLNYDVSMVLWGTTGNKNFYIEAYTPALNIQNSNEVFYEFGEIYNVTLDNNGERVHSGQSQTQILNVRPAIFNFFRGDVYNRTRLQNVSGTMNNLFILDKSVSDKYDSKVIGNGRAFVIDPFAREIYNPTLVRYGGSYQQGTLINDTNRFYGINFEEYDRQKGSIERFKIREKALRVFQERGVGVVNVYSTEMLNQDGTGNLIGSTKILNPINYYQGEFGIGNQYCSLTSSSSADYFVDPIKGYHIRLSRDGLTPLSELYKGQYYFPKIANKYLKDYRTGTAANSKILGVYDTFEEEYISIFQQGGTCTTYSISNSSGLSKTFSYYNCSGVYTFVTLAAGGSQNISAISGSIITQDSFVIVTPTSVVDFISPVTVGFNEPKNCYSSFYGYYPEWMICAENLLISWKNGQLYTHDSATKNNFYGVQDKSSITLTFNEKNILKKTFDYITIDANDTWDSATIGDVNTSLEQTSNLVSSDYELHEGFRHAALLRDSKSLGGVIEGDYLKGTWVEVKLNNSATNLVYLSGLYLGYQMSPRNF
jgi:hypothetical protein